MRSSEFPAYDNPAFDAYSYNARSEVTGAQRYHGTDVSDTSKVYGGRTFGYAYDPIGNRTSATEAVGGRTLTKSYTANALNQYTAIANPDAVGLRGSATNAATVTVNGNAVRSDDVASAVRPWHFALQADNAAGGLFALAEIVAVVDPPGTNTPDLVSTESGHVYAPPQNEALTYDDDGNLLSDGRWHYTWNGENRLVKAEEQVAPTNRQPYVVEYAYDHQGRMVRKGIKRRDAESQSETPVKAIAYAWDGYNIIAETVAQDNVTNTTYNVWGLDLDGTMQGAGGVGGLLAVVRDGNTFFPAYDANGNITEYVSTDGTITAHREYDPFGNTVVATGDASGFTHWFSTKPWCSVTGLCEYQYRKYSPVLGRWMSKDPIEEAGGINLYGYCWNDVINGVDFIGNDRYITHFDLLNYGGSGGTHLHVGVAVDTWKKIKMGKQDCCWAWMWTGILTFDFRPDVDVLNLFKGIVWKAKGRIQERVGLQLSVPITFRTTPEQDNAMLKMIRQEMKQPPFYNVFFLQCVFWSVTAINYGMEAGVEESCYPIKVIQPNDDGKI